MRGTFGLMGLVLAGSCLMSCQAFNDHKEEQSFLAQVAVPPAPDGGGNPDVTAPVCEPMASVVVQENAGAAATESLVGDESATTEVKTIDDSTIGVTITAASATVSFSIKKGEAGFSVCNASATKGSAEFGVESGTIMIGQFNASAAGKTLNAGTYTLSVSEKPTATKAVKALLGSKADGAPAKTEQIDGSYFSETVVPSVAK